MGKVVDVEWGQHPKKSSRGKDLEVGMSPTHLSKRANLPQLLEEVT